MPILWVRRHTAQFQGENFIGSSCSFASCIERREGQGEESASYLSSEAEMYHRWYQ